MAARNSKSRTVRYNRKGARTEAPNLPRPAANATLMAEPVKKMLRFCTPLKLPPLREWFKAKCCKPAMSVR